MGTLRMNGAIILGLLAVGALLGSVFGLEQVGVDPASVNPSATLTDEDIEFIQFMYPRVTALDRELSELSALIESRSRNLFALQAHNGQIRTLISEIRSWTDSHPTPPGFTDAWRQLASSLTEILELLDDGEDALGSFDFSGIAALVPRFNTAAYEIRVVQGTLTPYIG